MPLLYFRQASLFSLFPLCAYMVPKAVTHLHFVATGKRTNMAVSVVRAKRETQNFVLTF